MFLDYRARPCLVHGDLWHGNIAITDDGRPALYDPAAHYGDHEVDLAMTELLGAARKLLRYLPRNRTARGGSP